MVDVAEIEKRVDRAVAATIPMNANMGGIELTQYLHMMELAKTMATCRAAIPEWMRASVGDCLAIWQMAARWGLDPYYVASKTYLMESKSGTLIGFESQLIHSIIESLAPLKGRLRHEIKGEGDNRYCEVWGTFKGEDAPHRFKSEILGKRVKDIGTNDRGNFRGSPLWLTKPEVQLFYDASRDWARINCPEVLAGVYAREELPDHEPVDVTPKLPTTLAERLRASKEAHAGDRGFDAAHIKNEVAKNGSTVIDGSANHDAAQHEAVSDEDDSTRHGGGSSTAERHGDDDGGERGVDDQAAGAVAGDNDQADGTSSVGQETAPRSEDQGDIFPPDRKPEAAQGKGKRKR
jgi:hypothetical protein